MEESESPLPAFKAFVALYRKLKSDADEKSRLALQRQLDLLNNSCSSSSCIAHVDPQDVTCAEFITCLIDLLEDHNGNHLNIQQKVLDLILNLLKDNRVHKVLITQYPLLSVLLQCLMNACQHKQQALVLQCFRQLENVSYLVEVNSQDGFVPTVLEFLITQIVKSPSSIMFENCICLLRNLTRSDLVQAKVKSMAEFKTLCKVLLRQLPVANYLVASSSLSILTNLLIDDPLGQSLFGERSIQSTFHLAMTILVKSCSDYNTLKTTTDVIIRIMVCDSRRGFIINIYTKFREALRALLKNLESVKNPQCIDKLMELMIMLWNDNACQQLIRHCQSDETCCCPSLIHLVTLLINQSGGLFQLYSPNILDWLHQLCLHAIGTCGFNDANLESLIFILNERMEMKDEGRFNLDSNLNLLHKHLVIMKLMAGYKLHDFKSVLANHDHLWHDTLPWFLKNSILLLDKVELRQPLLNVMSVLMTVLEALQEHDGMKAVMSDALQSEGILLYVILSLRCTDEELVQNMSKYLPAIMRNHGNKFLSCVLEVNNKQMFENGRFNQQRFRSSKNSLNVFQPPVKDLRPGLQSVIDKIEDMKLKDSKLSEIIEVYETKINQMQQDVCHLEEALKCKMTDSQHLEQLNNQYRCSLAQNEAEALKFRNLLKQSEFRFEACEDELSQAKLKNKEITGQQETYQNSMKKLQRQVQKQEEANDQLNHRLEGMQKRYENAQNEYQNLSEKNIEQQRMTEKLKQRMDELLLQIESLTIEKDSARKDCIEKEAMIQEISCQHQAILEQKKVLETDNEALSSTAGIMKEELRIAEAKRKKLQQEVGEYEVLYKQVVSKVGEQEAAIKELEERLKKEQEITKMIHSLTGRIKSES